MNALDSMLEGDEPIVQQISQELGIFAAELFVEEYNNGCFHMTGFEETLFELRTTNVFISPLSSLSKRTDH